MDKENLEKEIEKGKRWTKPLTKTADFKTIPCPPYNDIRDYKQDKGCFLLIKIYPEQKEIGVAVCTYNMDMLAEYRGKTAQQIYFYLLNNTSYISRLDHAAYLGKELARAQSALESGTEYLQE